MKQMKNNKKSRFCLLFCVGVLLMTVMIPFLPVRDEGEIYDNTLRLHILANSDSTDDQILKIRVRDAILEKTAEIADGCTDVDNAKEIYLSNVGELEKTARDTLRKYGSDADVNVTLGQEYYPERQYGDVRLPSGRYTSLKVNIGECEGQNWWCVLFPPLCVDAAEADDVFVETGFTPNQIKLLTDSESPKYVIRFRLLEWAQSVAELFRK